MPDDRFDDMSTPEVLGQALLELQYWAEQQGFDAEHFDDVLHAQTATKSAPVAERFGLREQDLPDDYETLRYIAND